MVEQNQGYVYKHAVLQLAMGRVNRKQTCLQAESHQLDVTRCATDDPPAPRLASSFLYVLLRICKSQCIIFPVPVGRFPVNNR